MLLDISDYIDRHSIFPPDIVSSTNEYRQFTKLFCKRFQKTFDMRHTISRIASTSATDVKISSLQEMQQQQHRSRNMKTARTTIGKHFRQADSRRTRRTGKRWNETRHVPFSKRCASMRVAASAISSSGWASVVNCGLSRRAACRSSNPTTAISCGTYLSNRSSTCNAPAAILSECAKTPSTCGYSAIIRSMDLRPLSIS